MSSSGKTVNMKNARVYSEYVQRAKQAEELIGDLYSRVHQLETCNEESNSNTIQSYQFDSFKQSMINELKLIKSEILNLSNENLILKNNINLIELLKNDYHRSLHWVIKIGNLKKSIDFYSKVFDMIVLRHEEFNEGCDAKCNGDYSRPWSKTMIGYGDEKEHFSLELTYNYGIKGYQRGNDLRYIGLYITKQGLQNAKDLGYSIKSLDPDSNNNNNNKNDKNDKNKDNDTEDIKTQSTISLNNVADTVGQAMSDKASEIEYSEYSILGPDEVLYHCRVVEKLPKEPFWSVALNVKDVEISHKYWVGTLDMHCLEYVPNFYLRVSYGDSVPLEFYQLGKDESLNHYTASGRIAFNTRINRGPYIISDYIKSKEIYKIHTNPVTLSTDGKADVLVVILQDPDDYEICFVGEQGFDELCTTKDDDDFIDWEKRAKLGADCDKGKFDKVRIPENLQKK